MKGFVFIWKVAALGVALLMGLGEASAADTWEVMISKFKAANRNGVNLQLEGERMQDVGERLGDCDTLLVAEYLLRSAALELGKSVGPDAMGHDCERTQSPLLFVIGWEAYAAGKAKDAERWWRATAEAAAGKSPAQRHAALQALGVVMMGQRRYGEALGYFEQAHAEFPDRANPTEMNNLAYASYLVGRCEESVRWADLALEKIQILLKEKPAEAEVFINERNAILLTQLQAQMRQGDRAAADGTVEALRIPGAFEQRELAAVCILTLYAQWSGRKDWFAVVHPHLVALHDQCNPEEVASTLGANVVLFDGDWEAHWDALLEVPLAFRGGLPLACAEEVSMERSSGAWAWFRWGAAAFFVAMLGFVAFVFARVWALRGVKEAPQNSLELAVEEAITNKGGLSAGRKERAVVALGELMRRRLSISLEDSAEFQAWSELEQQVALGVANGEHTKAIAARLGVSTSLVYKSRHALRSSLELSGNDSLKKRLIELMAMLLLGLPMAAQSTDSLRYILFEGDRVAWQEAVASGRWGDLPEPYDVAFQPQGVRPAWAAVADSALWYWYQAAYEALELEYGALHAKGEWSPDRAASRLEHLRTGNLNQLAWALLALGTALAAAGVVLVRQRRELLSGFGGDAGQILFAGIHAASPHPEAEAAWRAFKASPVEPSPDDERWLLLTDSEREVAACLAQHLSVEEIARQLACTKGHVYNLRSSIRQKWRLEPDEDLARTIHRIQSGR